MAKKKRSKKGSSESRTALIGAVIFLVAGLGCLIYGKTFYKSDKMVSPDDVRTGVTATVTDVEKRERNLSVSDRKREEKNGRTENEIRWEYVVTYTVSDNGRDYTYEEVKNYVEGKAHPKVGDTDVINYAVVDGEFIVHPETSGTNSAVICGFILMGLAVVAFGVGMFIR